MVFLQLNHISYLFVWLDIFFIEVLRIIIFGEFVVDFCLLLECRFYMLGCKG